MKKTLIHPEYGFIDFSFKNENKLKQKDFRLLLEAYRRAMMFNTDKPLEVAWLGLGTPSQYKSEFFTTVSGRETPKVTNWYKLTESGLKIFYKLLKDYPFPQNLKKRNELNSKLFNL